MEIIIPSIVASRLAGAVVVPTISRWNSLADMVDRMADLGQVTDPASPLLPRLHKISEFARGQAVSMQQPGPIHPPESLG